MFLKQLVLIKFYGDFAHQSITMATALNPSWFELADIKGGRQRTIDLAGWEGDATGNAGAEPSMGTDDYKADLDAVNIVAHMKHEGTSYSQAMSEYYDSVNKDSSVREQEFVQNEGYDEVKRRVFESLIPKGNYGDDDYNLSYLQDHYPDSYNFLISLRPYS